MLREKMYKWLLTSWMWGEAYRLTRDQRRLQRVPSPQRCFFLSMQALCADEESKRLSPAGCPPGLSISLGSVDQAAGTFPPSWALCGGECVSLPGPRGCCSPPRWKPRKGSIFQSHLSTSTSWCLGHCPTHSRSISISRNLNIWMKGGNFWNVSNR